jgi:hypothetical protein
VTRSVQSTRSRDSFPDTAYSGWETDWGVLTAEGLAVPENRSVTPPPAGEPASEPERKAVVLTMRGNPEWKAWLKQLSKHCHMKVSVCVEQALMEYAERRAFTETAPDRTD